MFLLKNFTKHSNRMFQTIHAHQFHTFSESERGEKHLSSSYWAQYYLDAKSWKKEKENYRWIPVLNLGIIILNEILEDWIQQCIKRIIHNDQGEFIPGMQDWFTIWKSINAIHFNRLKKKNHITLIDTNQAFSKIEHPFMMTTLCTVGI